MVVLEWAGCVFLFVFGGPAIVVLVAWVVVDSGAALVRLLWGHWALHMGCISVGRLRRLGLALWLG